MVAWLNWVRCASSLTVSRRLILEELSDTLAGYRTLLAKQQWSAVNAGMLTTYRELMAQLRSACTCRADSHAPSPTVLAAPPDLMKSACSGETDPDRQRCARATDLFKRADERQLLAQRRDQGLAEADHAGDVAASCSMSASYSSSRIGPGSTRSRPTPTPLCRRTGTAPPPNAADSALLPSGAHGA
ncbi:hypothetical protein GCM10010271_72890 [Streptomyces kurssanovii]|nr:hypothetical protein GCM10010271_72890 [Streptomyces kurssanovii]